MSHQCAITTCKRASRALCDCCNQRLCREHFNEHDDILNSQLHPLIDEINKLGERLTIININQVTGNAQEKLDQWRVDCHIKINRLYEQKCQELERYVQEKLDKQRKEIDNLRSKIAELNDTQETTRRDIDLLASGIRTLDLKMNEIEQSRIQIAIDPLIIDNSLISIENANIHQFSLSTLPLPYETINISGITTNKLTSNERFLLVHIDSHLCLIDKQLSIVKREKWIYNPIEDMCCSSILNCFIVITLDNVFLVHENDMSIERVQSLQMDKCWSCACSNKALYLSRFAHDSTILEWSLIPSIQLVKKWYTTDALTQTQRIDNIIYNNETLCLSINDQSSKTKLIELRSSKTFDKLWSLRLDTDYNIYVVRCSLLNYDEWLATDWKTSSLSHISNDGKLKEVTKHNVVPYNINLFNSRILVIRDHDGIKFHKV